MQEQNRFFTRDLSAIARIPERSHATPLNKVSADGRLSGKDWHQKTPLGIAGPLESCVKKARPRIAVAVQLTWPLWMMALVVVQASSAFGQLPQAMPPRMMTLGDANDRPADPLERLPTERRLAGQLAELSDAAQQNKLNDVQDLLEILRATDPLLMVSSRQSFVVSLGPGNGGMPLMTLVEDPSEIYVPLHRDLVFRIQSFNTEVKAQISIDPTSADAALQRTLATFSSSELVRFLQQFAGSKASLKAHLLLATIHADRGHHSVAQYWLKPLLTEEAEPELREAARRMQEKIAAAEPGAPGIRSAAVDRTAESSESGREASAATEAAPVPSLPSDLSAETSASKSGDTSADKSAGSASGAQSTKADPSAIGVAEAIADADAENPSNSKAADSSELANSDAPVASSLHSSGPKYVHWMHALPLPATARKRSQELVQASSDLGLLPWTTWSPEIDDQRIYIRTPQLISARDRRTGRHLWTRSFNLQQPTLQESEDDLPVFQFRLDENSVNEVMNSEEVRLVHRNEIVGRMASDAERLFAVCQIGQNSGPALRDDNLRLRAIIGQGRQLSAGVWELIAFEKSTGRRVWTSGGSPVEKKFGNELAMAWFAGPPAVYGSDLFQVVEWNGSIQLACLNAETGQLKWSVPLVYPDLDIAQDPARQLLAAQILAEAGVIYATTTTGWVCAVDTLTQSVLWARPLPSHPGANSGARSIRSLAFLQMNVPIGRHWHSRAPFRSSTALVIAAAESAKMVVLDTQSGRLLKERVDAESQPESPSLLSRFFPESPTSPIPAARDLSTAVLYIDKTMLVTASNQTFTATSLPDMNRMWLTLREPRSATPTGAGVRRGDELIVPLSDGSLEVISLKNGKVTQNLPGLRPASSCGSLYPVDEEIISFGPGHLSLLSDVPADSPDDADPMQQAIFLLQTGRLDEAREALSRVDRNPLNAQQMRNLGFRIALAAYASEGLPSPRRIEEISQQAHTTEERALSEYLRLKYILESAPETAAPALITALGTDESVLKMEIPDAGSLLQQWKISIAENPLEVGTLSGNSRILRHSLRSWILLRLRQLIESAEVDRRKELILNLASLSDADVMVMSSRFLTSDYLRRTEAHLQAGKLSETVLQLLIVTAEFVRPPAAEVPPEDSLATEHFFRLLQRTVELSESTTTTDLTHAAMLRRMTKVLSHELRHKITGTPDPLLDDPREQLTDSWNASPDSAYTMLPVSTFGQVSHRLSSPIAIELSSNSDPFLSAFQWTVQRSPGALTVRSVTDPKLSPWLLRINGGEAAFMKSDEELFRFGSVLVLQNSNGLSAFSVTDQRWLWTRQMPGGVSRRSSLTMNRPFADFSSSTSILNEFGRRVIGSNGRWLCVSFGGTVELLDLYSGNQIWSMSGMRTSSVIVACNSAIIVDEFGRQSMMLSPTDGNRLVDRSKTGVPKITDSTIRGAGDHIVVWRPKKNTQDVRALIWIDPISEEVFRTVELPDAQFSQFLDSETLVSVTDRQTCHIVNLRTGVQETVCYSNGNEEDRTQLAPAKIVVAADAANYYFFERLENAIFMPGAMYDVSAEPIHRELRAVSRSTGKLVWVKPVTEKNVLACINGIEPVLLCITISDNPRANAAVIPGLQMQLGNRYLIEGHSRTTGRRRLNYPVVAQYPIPNLRLSSDGDGQLDLEAFGNRVRFLPTPKTPGP